MVDANAQRLDQSRATRTGCPDRDRGDRYALAVPSEQTPSLDEGRPRRHRVPLLVGEPLRSPSRSMHRRALRHLLSRAATVMRSTSGQSRNPIPGISPSRLQVRTVPASASAPNRQCQPRSPGCNWIGASSRCQLRRAPTTSLSRPASGVFNSVGMLRSHHFSRIAALGLSGSAGSHPLLERPR